MFQLRQRAYARMHTNKRVVFRCAMLSGFTGLCAAASVLTAIAVLIAGTDAKFRELPLIGAFISPDGVKVAVICLLFLGTAYTYTSNVFTFTLHALLANRADNKNPRLQSFLRFGSGFRYALYAAEKTAAALRLLPSCFAFPVMTVLILLALLAVGVPAYLLIAGVGLCAAQTILAVCVFFVRWQKYSLTLYLLCLHPLLPVSDALKSSVLLTERKRISIALYHLRTLPMRVLSRRMIPLPYIRVYLTAIETVFCERVYGERCVRKNSAAIVYYIDGNTKIIEESDAE